jgi:hypothetical protein
MLLIAEVDERVEVFDRLGEDMSAAPAVAAVRAAEFDELLASERQAAGAAGAALDMDARAIEELHAPVIAKPAAAARRRPGAAGGRCHSSPAVL